MERNRTTTSLFLGGLNVTKNTIVPRTNRYRPVAADVRWFDEKDHIGLTTDEAMSAVDMFLLSGSYGAISSCAVSDLPPTFHEKIDESQSHRS